MNPAEHLLLHQSELLAGGQLPLAGEAGEAGQVIDVALGPADPVRGVDVPAAARTPGAVPPAEEPRVPFNPSVQICELKSHSESKRFCEERLINDAFTDRHLNTNLFYFQILYLP